MAEVGNGFERSRHSNRCGSSVGSAPACYRRPSGLPTNSSTIFVRFRAPARRATHPCARNRPVAALGSPGAEENLHRSRSGMKTSNVNRGQAGIHQRIGWREQLDRRGRRGSFVRRAAIGIASGYGRFRLRVSTTTTAADRLCVVGLLGATAAFRWLRTGTTGGCRGLRLTATTRLGVRTARRRRRHAAGYGERTR